MWIKLKYSYIVILQVIAINSIFILYVFMIWLYLQFLDLNNIVKYQFI